MDFIQYISVVFSKQLFFKFSHFKEIQFCHNLNFFGHCQPRNSYLIEFYYETHYLRWPIIIPSFTNHCLLRRRYMPLGIFIFVYSQILLCNGNS